MTYVIMRNYSRNTDVVTGQEFTAVQVQDRRDPAFGCSIAHAKIAAKDAKLFKDRRGFEVVTDLQFAQLTGSLPEPEVTEPITGDPLTDPAAGANSSSSVQTPASGESGPPPPPG